MNNDAMVVMIAGVELLLHPQRALIWPAMRTAFIADLHLGKAEVFRRAGVPIPEGDTARDLRRLDALIEAFGLERIIALGDFVHAASSPLASHAVAFADWRTAHSRMEFVVVAGNHDRRAAGVELTQCVTWRSPGFALPPFVCRHHPGPADAGYVLCGHLHPVVTLHGSHRERTRTPVCWIRPDYAVLPSFGSFTGGGDIAPEPGDQLFAFAADRVWRMPVG